MQGHGNVEREGHIVRCAHHKEEHNQDHILPAMEKEALINSEAIANLQKQLGFSP